MAAARLMPRWAADISRRTGLHLLVEERHTQNNPMADSPKEVNHTVERRKRIISTMQPAIRMHRTWTRQTIIGWDMPGLETPTTTWIIHGRTGILREALGPGTCGTLREADPRALGLTASTLVLRPTISGIATAGIGVATIS